MASPRLVTADFVYVRLHGPEGAYQGSYTAKALAGWALQFREWEAAGKDIYCYFDNDQAGYAAQNALQIEKAARRLREAGHKPPFRCANLASPGSLWFFLKHF